MNIFKLIFVVLYLTLLIACTEVNSPPSNFAISTPPKLMGSPLPEITNESHGLILHSNIETIGVMVTGDNLPETAELQYRKSSETNWLSGHPLIRIDDGRLVGTLFELLPATSYHIKVLYEATEITDSTTTQPDVIRFLPEKIVYVDDDATPGGDGTSESPFQTIQEGVNHAGPGTKILVADGIYHERVSINSSGVRDNWIQVMAKGTNAILDGADHLTGASWKADPREPNIWFTYLGSPTHYLARDGLRYYEYDNLDSLKAGTGHNNEPMQEGWVVDEDHSTLYVRSLDNPIVHSWQLTGFDHAFYVEAQDWVWIEGFEIQYYEHGLILNNASNVVIRQNRIHNVIEGIQVNWTGGEDRSNNTRIEYNEVSDIPVNEWPWGAVKGTTMEGAAISLQGHNGAIIRGNHLHHFFNGIYTGKWGDLENPNIASNVDIYNNNIHDIGDDALEPEGASVNQSFRNNIIDQTSVGISLAPIVYGPLWVMRNVFSNYDGTCIKWDSSSHGVVLIYHNTCWTNEENTNALTIGSPIHNMVIRNNIFRGTRYAFEASLTGSTADHWDYNNWYTTRGSDDPHFKWENVRYGDIAALCLAIEFECHGHDSDPGLTNPEGGDFTLFPNSPNINRGVVIPGINDDSSFAPDIGAFEAIQPDLRISGTQPQNSYAP